jgi:hypothetical protein
MLSSGKDECCVGIYGSSARGYDLVDQASICGMLVTLLLVFASRVVWPVPRMGVASMMGDLITYARLVVDFCLTVSCSSHDLSERSEDRRSERTHFRLDLQTITTKSCVLLSLRGLQVSSNQSRG